MSKPSISFNVPFLLTRLEKKVSKNAKTLDAVINQMELLGKEHARLEQLIKEYDPDLGANDRFELVG